MKKFKVIAIIFILTAVAAIGWLWKASVRQAKVAEKPSIHVAAISSGDLLKEILLSGCNVDEVDKANNVTALWLATTTQKHENVAILLAHGADPNISVGKRDYPLAIATHWGNADTVKQLLERGADVNGQSGSRTALHESIVFGRSAIFDMLLGHPEVSIDQVEKGTGYTPLHLAVQHDRHEFISKLLEMRADVSLVDAAGNTALDLANHKPDASIAARFASSD